MLTKFIPMFINNADKLLRWLQSIKGLPPWAFLFTTDTDLMYTNIDTEHTIKIISEWLDELSTHPEFPPGYPLDAVKSAMKTIMRTNHFEFGDMNFLQLMGTVMGTSDACMWATIYYYGHHEVKTPVPNFQQYLHNGKLTRWIEDIFEIWVCNECKCWKNCKHWKDFLSSLPFRRLTWTTEDPRTRRYSLI